MSTTTANFGLIEPTVLGDANAWGTMLNTNSTNLDAFLLSLASSYFGSTAPVIPVPNVATSGQIWVNNSVPTLWTVNIFDGTSWVSMGTLNTVTHVFTPPSAGFKVNVQTFVSSGTYTPSLGLVYAIVEVQGGGGGAGFTSSNTVFAANGAGGGYAKSILLASDLGSSQVVTIGAGGIGGATVNTDGTSGGVTSVGSLLSATGGSGSPAGNTGAIPVNMFPTPGMGINGNQVNLPGGYPTAGFLFSGGPACTGTGGNGAYGTGGAPGVSGQGGSPRNGINAVSGLGGGGTSGCIGNASGGNGGSGQVLITEFIES